MTAEHEHEPSSDRSSDDHHHHHHHHHDTESRTTTTTTKKHTLHFFDDTHAVSSKVGVELEVIRHMSDVLPPDFAIHKVLGVGANNRALRVQWDGAVRVLRVPRRSSDTRQRGNAKWEFAHTARASMLKCAPTLYRGWYLRHAEGAKWPSGLYLLMEYFAHDLDKVFHDKSMWDRALAHRANIGRGIVDALTKLSSDELLVYDLKPSNVVLSFDDDDDDEEEDDDDDGGGGASDGARPTRHAQRRARATKTNARGAAANDRRRRSGSGSGSGVTVRIIDFGRDFCEWGGNKTERDRSTPIIDILRRTIVAEGVNASGNAALVTPTKGSSYVDDRLQHALFATMLVNLAATTTRHLYQARKRTRMPKELRQDINPVAPSCHSFLSSMQGRNVRLLRLALRYDEVRGVLEHYHGRRNAGTRRTLQFASGEE